MTLPEGRGAEDVAPYEILRKVNSFRHASRATSLGEGGFFDLPIPSPGRAADRRRGESLKNGNC